MKKSIFILCLVLFTILWIQPVSSQTTGNNAKRTIAEFNTLVNESSLDVEYVQNNEYTVRVVAKQNHDYVIAEVSKGVLTISLKKGVSINNDDVTVIVSAPSLVEVQNIGVGDIDLSDFTGTTLTITNSESGDIEFSFSRTAKLDAFKTVTIHNTGTGDIDGYCYADKVSIDNKGAGDIELKGKVADLIATNMGVGDMDLSDFRATRAKLRNTGVGEFTAFVTGMYTAEDKDATRINVLGGGTKQ